jgi:collagenase-like PrtC family protease
LQVWVTCGLRQRGEVPGTITAERLRALAALGVDAVLVNDVGIARAAGDKPPPGPAKDPR